jgi:hypothetical protein
MKRSNRKRHRPEEVVAKLRQADESLHVAAGWGVCSGGASRDDRVTRRMHRLSGDGLSQCTWSDHEPRVTTSAGPHP